MENVPAIFCLLVAAAGWFYAFNSRAALRLAIVEHERLNRLRIRLRRAGGVAMIILGAAFYVGYYGVDPKKPTTAFLVAWCAVIVCLIAVLALGLADIQLTRKLRRSLQAALQLKNANDAAAERSARDDANAGGS